MVPPERLPYKSVAIALLFCVFLGPVGLLYATCWGSFYDLDGYSSD